MACRITAIVFLSVIATLGLGGKADDPGLDGDSVDQLNAADRGG
jgi:hypothetical protein